MSSTPPGKLTPMEILSDFPAAGALAMAIVAKFQNLPKPTKAVDYVTALGFAQGSVAYSLAMAFDRVKGGHVTIDEVEALIGVDANGVLGQAFALAKTVVAQSKD